MEKNERCEYFLNAQYFSIETECVAECEDSVKIV